MDKTKDMEIIEKIDRLNVKLDSLEKKINGISQNIEERDRVSCSKMDAIQSRHMEEEKEMKEMNNRLTLLAERMMDSLKCSRMMKVFLKSQSGDLSRIVLSPYFDWRWYMDKYNMRWKHAKDAARHYLEQGWKLYWDPSPYFCTIAYLIENWDVKTSGCNPLLHYEKFGIEEGRKIGDVSSIKEQYRIVRDSEYYDESWYRDNYKMDAQMDAVYHFLFVGVPEFCNPSSRFSCLDYFMDNMREVGCSQNPLVHYEKNKAYNSNLVVKEVQKRPDQGEYEICASVNQKEKTGLMDVSRKEPLPHKKTVDIIICVYNALEDVKKCIASVLAYTENPYRVIVVDDNSAEQTASYLKGLSANYPQILLIRNDSQYHGYTYAANIGLKHSDADYSVMLNSDTIVSDHWIDKMVACAESEDAIGIVGPLSNTASWQSVPRLAGENGDWCHNEIPEGFTVEKVARMVAANSGRIYPQVPLLNGFCLMIKREVIEKIGYFDEENFGRGFAEEDDYNTRAVKAGFKLAIADDTYIYHAQSKSYTDEKRLELCKVSGDILRKKHGREYIEQCSAFMAENKVLDGIRRRIGILYEKEKIYQRCKALYEGKKILFLLPGSNASGGTNVIVQEGMALMQMGVDVTILNVVNNRENFLRAYGGIRIPVIWINDYSEFHLGLAQSYDVVVCTLFRTVEYCRFLENCESPKVLYYIQDYEPYFIKEESENGKFDYEEYDRAVRSYTMLPNCIRVTKTQWNRDEVKKHTGAECKVIGPSVNIGLFMPRVMKPKAQVTISAMIRPDTKRRAPQMTYDVLRALWMEFGERIVIKIFGADPDQGWHTKLFFAKQKKDFHFINYGLTSPEQTAVILAESDIFMDLSEFQAMGLTAMEAMACGCAVIVPQNGGTSCFAKNGENCLVIDTSDYGICMETARNLIVDHNLRGRLGKTACGDMTEFYPEKASERFLDAAFRNG